MLLHEAVEQAIAEEYVRLRGPRLQATGPYRVWVTLGGATACKFCRRLHGTRRRSGQPFPYDHALPWWSPGVDERNRPIPPGLQPPRHPNCRCTLVPGDAFAEDPDAAIQAAQLQSQALSASIDTISQQAYDAWQAAGNQAAHHLYVTLRVTDPNRSIESVLRQPDVQAVLRRPFDHATDLTRQAISEAWIEGAAQGHAAGNQDLQTAGFEPIGPVEIDQGPLNRLLDDAGANGDAAYQRFRDAIPRDPDAVREAVRRVTQDQALRARSGADVAGKTASILAKLATFILGLIGS